MNNFIIIFFFLFLKNNKQKKTYMNNIFLFHCHVFQVELFSVSIEHKHLQ